jgi:branched-chain amino acid transport system permease protein
MTTIGLSRTGVNRISSSIGTVLRAADGRWRVWPGALALVLVALAATQLSGQLGRYQLDIATTLLGYVALAQAWNILAGYSGQVSLGVSAFVGTGAYAAALVEIHAGVGYLFGLVVALIAGGVLALLLAVPLLRMRGDYFAVGTLAAALALQAWVLNWSYAGGSTGLTFPLDGLPDSVQLYRLACLIAGLVMAIAFIIAYSRFGLRLRAVRDNEAAATGLGVSATRHRLAALLISGALSGLTGGLIAMQQVSFEPTGMLGITWTINALVMTIVGGIGTVIGPLVGAIAVYYLLTKQLESYQTVSVIIEGSLLIVIVRFAPRGLWPLLIAAVTWLVRHVPGQHSRDDVDGQSPETTSTAIEDAA